MENILELFSRYGIDFALMAAAAAMVTLGLDYALFNRLNLDGRAERAVKFLPYVLGILFYCIYSLACNCSISCFFANLAEVLQQGLAVGTLSFVIRLYAVKIISGRKAEITDEEAVASLIEGYISPDEMQNAAKLICDAAKEGDSGKTESILAEYAAEGVTAEELEVLRALILNYFGL